MKYPMFKKGTKDANETEVHKRVQERGGAGTPQWGKDSRRSLPGVRADRADGQRLESAVSGSRVAGFRERRAQQRRSGTDRGVGANGRETDHAVGDRKKGIALAGWNVEQKRQAAMKLREHAYPVADICAIV